jgi:anti-sigma regulatory factor (Ser/Thr protein kinase)
MDYFMNMQIYLQMAIPLQAGFKHYACELISTITVRAGGESYSYHVLSAFNEAFNNIIEHSGKCQEDEVIIEVKQSDNTILLQLEYDGNPFDSEYLKLDSAPDPLAESGYGLYIMKSFMDEVRYQYCNNKNRWTMIKEIPHQKKDFIAL